MAELVNGYITVRTELGEAAAPARTVPRGRRPSESETRARVVRLRREGWSYRRIAATLELRYGAVAEILDGPTIWVGDYSVLPPAAEPAPLPGPADAAGTELSAPRPAAPARPLPVSEDAVEAVLLQHARLSDKVDALLRAAEQQRSAIGRLESSLLGAMRTENARLADRIMGGVKALFERLLPTPSRRAGPPSGDSAE
jgi:hypothetical protein